MRRYGQDVVTLESLIQLAYESGRLRDPTASAAEISLLLHWLRERELPRRLIDARAIEERRQRGQQG